MGENKAERSKVFAVVAAGTLLSSIGLYVLFPFNGHIDREQTLTIINNPIAIVWAVIAFVSWLACLVASIVCLLQKSKFGWLAFAGFLIAPLAICVDTFRHLADYEDFATIKDEFGNEYHLLLSHFWMDSSIYIGKLESKIGPWANYQKLSPLVSDESFACLAIVRPSGAAESPRLYINANHMLIGVSNGNRACFAYDLKKGISYSYGGGDGKKSENIQTLSPFLLIGKDDKPSEEDFNAYVENETFDRAKLEVIKTELKNPNKRVREMAYRILREPTKKAMTSEESRRD